MCKAKESVLTAAKGFVFERCAVAVKRIVEPVEELSFYNQVKPMKSLLLV